MCTKTQLLHYCHSDQWCLVLRSVSTKSKKSFKLVNWIPKLVQLGQLGRPRTRSTLDPHWSSRFALPEPENTSRGHFQLNSGHFGSFLGPLMAQKCKKRRDVVETQLNLPRGIQNNHFFGQIPKSLTTPPPLPLLGHCALRIFLDNLES